MRAASLPGDWDGLVVICAGTPWDGIPFPEHHVAERLARRHAPVLYVDPPVSHVTARRHPEYAASLQGPRLRLIEPRLARLTPVVLPGVERPLVRSANQALVRRSIRRATAALGGEVAAVVLASQNDLFGACGERRRIVYATDDLVAGADLLGADGARLRSQVRRQAQHADLVVGVSEVICDAWRALGVPTELVPNGVDVGLFADVDDSPLPPDVELPAPVAGFVGHLSERIDIALLEAVAATGTSLLLVGPRQNTFEMARLDRVLSRPNVRWVGPKPFAELPSYLRSIDVGLTPYADSAFNRASFPLKTLEYLAAGRAAVATDLPATRWLETDLVTIASGPPGYAAAVTAELGRPRTPPLMAARRAFARQHSWEGRAEHFAALLGRPARPPETATGAEAAGATH